MAAGLSDVRARIVAASARVDRDPDEITLVAVSKTATPAQIRRAHAEGVRDFGENRADLLQEHHGAVPDDVRWHFVGRLQSNKVRKIQPLCHLFHAMDRLSLAEVWARDPDAPPVLIEVNVSGEPQKAGFAPAEVATALARLGELGVVTRGLMTMAPLTVDPEATRPHFAALRRLRDRLRPEFPALQELSMGMTDDFAVAIEEGATILRVGRAIFRASAIGD